MPDERNSVIQSWFDKTSRIDALDQQKLKKFMNCFSENAPEEVDSELIDYIRHNDMEFLHTLDPLIEKGHFKDAWTSIDDFIKFSNNVYIFDKDGNMTTYAEKFLNNATTDELWKQEEPYNRKGINGRVMLAQLAMVLSGHPAAKEMLGEDATIIIAQPGEDIITLTDAKNVEALKQQDERLAESKRLEDELKKIETELREKERKYLSKKEDIDRVHDRNLPVPVPPREENGFRRFFCALGFPHSAKYKEMKTKYEEDMVKKRQYEEEVKQKMEAVEAVREEYELQKAQYPKQKQTLETQLADIKNTIQNEQEKTTDISYSLGDRILRVKDLQKDKTDNKIKEYTEKVNDPKNVQMMMDSKLPPFVPGGLEATINLANNAAKMKQSEQFHYMLDSLFGPDAGAKAWKSLDRSKDKAQKKNFYANTYEEFKQRCAESKKLFEKVFKKPCTAENVSDVMNTLKLQSVIDQRIDDDRKTTRDVSTNHRSTKLSVSERNLEIAAHVLMSGLKTAVVETMERNAKKQKDQNRDKSADKPQLPDAECKHGNTVPRLPGV